MSSTEEARRRWIEEKDSYEDFAELIAERVKVAIQARGIWCDTSSRAKDVPSLVKKLLKQKHTYEFLPDKAGARCVVRYVSDLKEAIAVVHELFICSDADDKQAQLQQDRVGYISIHFEVRLKADDSEVTKFPSEAYFAELQIRPLGQHWWAEMSHDTIYKNDETLAALPAEIKRRVNLMAGLVEVADNEFNRLNQEQPLDTAIQIYKALEPFYYRLTSRRPDPELSLAVIKLLLPLYGKNDVRQIQTLIQEFFSQNQEALAHVYNDPDDWKASAFLYQPEALMILERLGDDELEVRRVWNEQFPEKELERVANAFGISFD
jgi:ppGpp synthetase/RelA/SpoT-type nucleotidyltranferase